MISWRHIPALDGIRAIAILLVIPHNANIYSLHPGMFWPLAVAAHSGWIGVQLFFVLSGFLITGSLLDSRDSRHYYRSFYVRRVLRILPLYYLALLVGLLLVPSLVSQSPEATSSRAHQLWLWLFLSNWTQPFDLGVNGFSHFWSLAVEEQFYIFWPLVVMRWQGHKLLTVCLAVTCVALLSRIVLIRLAAPQYATYMFTICRMDALALGASAAILIRDKAATRWIEARAMPLLTMSGLALLAGAFLTRFYTTDALGTQLLGYPMLALIFAILILVAVIDDSRTPPTLLNRILSLAPLRSIGRYSYAMYVFHLPLAIMLDAPLKTRLAPLGTAAAPLFALIIVLLSYVTGFLSYRLIESPFLRLKPRLAPIHQNAKRVNGLTTPRTHNPH